MKRLIFLIAMLMLSSSLLEAQTFYYKYFSRENLTTGMKERASGSAVYITFRSGKREFFQSDSEGEELIGINRNSDFGQSGKRQAPRLIPARFATFPGQIETIIPMDKCSGVFSSDGWDGDYRRYRCYYYTYYDSFNFRTMQVEEVVLDREYLYLYFSEDYSELYIKKDDVLTTLRRSESPAERSSSHLW